MAADSRSLIDRFGEEILDPNEKQTAFLKELWSRNLILKARHPQMLEALGKDVSSFGSIFKDAYGRNQQDYRLDCELTMTGREIAELVEKRRDNVKRTIETLVEQGVIVHPQIEDERGTDTVGRPRTTQVYRFSGDRGKRDSIVVVVQLCPEFTARLVDRWQELKARIAQRVAIPQLPEALRLTAAFSPCN